MPVEKDIDLGKPLTEEDINLMEEEANRLEELAKQAQEDAKKTKKFQKEEEKILNQAVKNVEKAEREADKAEKARKRIGKSVKEVNKLAEHRAGLGEMGGARQFQERDPFGEFGGGEAFAGRLKTGRTGFGTGQEQAPMGGILQMQGKREDLIKGLKETDKRAEKERKENSRRLAQQRKILGTIQKGEQEFFSMGRNPIGFGMGKMTGMLAKGGIYGLIALAVISMAQQIFEEVKKLYGPGGPFDIRKQMMDRDREMIEIEHIIDRRAGRVFFTADTDLIQGSPEINSGNTNRVVQQTLRYQNLHHDE